MICDCTSGLNDGAPCRIPCKALRRELKGVEGAQREILMSSGSIADLLDSQLDVFAETAVEREAMISEAVERLPARQRLCLGLYFGNGWQPHETACHLGISRSAVRVHLRRAVSKIFAALEEEPPPELRDLLPRRAKSKSGYFIEGEKSISRSSHSVASIRSAKQRPEFTGGRENDGEHARAG